MRYLYNSVKEVDLDSKDPWKSLTFDMSALLHLEHTSSTLMGHFSTKGDYVLSAEIYDLDWAAISNLYSHFYDKKLSVPDFDFAIEYVYLTVSRDDGLKLLVDGAKVGHYAAGEAAKISGSSLVSVAKGTVAVYAKVEDVAIDVGKTVIGLFSLFINVTELEFCLDLDKAIEGCAFKGHIVGSFHEKPFRYDIEFYHANMMKLVNDTFKNLVEEFKKGITDFIDKIVDYAAGSAWRHRHYFTDLTRVVQYIILN